MLHQTQFLYDCEVTTTASAQLTALMIDTEVKTVMVHSSSLAGTRQVLSFSSRLVATYCPERNIKPCIAWAHTDLVC